MDNIKDDRYYLNRIITDISLIWLIQIGLRP